MRRVWTAATLVAVVTLVAAGCSSSSKSPFTGSTSPTGSTGTSAIVWPAPPDPMARARAAGLVPGPAETLVFHVHAHLDVFVNGESVIVPAGLGIDTTNPAVHVFPDYPKGSGATGYGGIDPPCNTACISPLHTHDVSGIIHTESLQHKYNTLGEFFIEWDVKLDQSCVNTYCKPKTKIAFYVNGKPFTGDPRTIQLTNFKEIAIVIGTPPAQIPATANWNLI